MIWMKRAANDMDETKASMLAKGKEINLFPTQHSKATLLNKFLCTECILK